MLKVTLMLKGQMNCGLPPRAFFLIYHWQCKNTVTVTIANDWPRFLTIAESLGQDFLRMIVTLKHQQHKPFRLQLLQLLKENRYRSLKYRGRDLINSWWSQRQWVLEPGHAIRILGTSINTQSEVGKYRAILLGQSLESIWLGLQSSERIHIWLYWKPI